MRYEILDPQGNVFNVIVADEAFMAEVYPAGNYRVAPDAPAPDTRPRHITEGAWKDRLGFALVAGIASSTHPICLGLKEMLNNRRHVDLDRPDLPVLLGNMVALSLPAPIEGLPGSGPITAEKVAEVLGAPVLEEERP